MSRVLMSSGIPSRAAALILAVVLAAAAWAMPPSLAHADDEAALASAREDLAGIRATIERAQAEVREADEELADADRILGELEAVVNEVATAVDGQEAAVAAADQRLATLQAEYDELVTAFNRRATRMFKLGPTRSLDLLLSGEDAADAMARSSYLRVVLEGDQVDLEMLSAGRVALDAERSRTEAERERLQVLLDEQRGILAEAQELRDSRALAAADARDRIELLEQQQDDLQVEEARIVTLIERRQAEERRRRAAARQAASRVANGSGGTTSAPSRSGYAWPLCAPVTSGYGPRWGRMHRGIDLGAPTGRAIGAARAGRVIFAGWQGGYGRLVLIDHGDGVVTAYAHMSSFAVGAGRSVQRGQTIGGVGSSGNSTGPHLHLEFRVNGRSVNPRQYLSGGPC